MELMQWFFMGVLFTVSVFALAWLSLLAKLEWYTWAGLITGVVLILFGIGWAGASFLEGVFQSGSMALIYTLSWMGLMLIFLSAHPALGSYEPFAMMFSLEGLGIQWYILPAALIGSFFVPSFWCRLFCPVGLYLNEIVRLRRGILGRFTGSGGKKYPPELRINTVTNDGERPDAKT